MKTKLETRKAELEQMLKTWSDRITELSRDLREAQNNLFVVRGALGEVERLLDEPEPAPGAEPEAS